MLLFKKLTSTGFSKPRNVTKWDVLLFSNYTLLIRAVNSRGAGGARALPEFWGSAYWSLSITTRILGFKKLSTALLMTTDQGWDKAENWKQSSIDVENWWQSWDHFSENLWWIAQYIIFKILVIDLCSPQSGPLM